MPLLAIVEVCDILLSDLTNNKVAVGNTSFDPVRLLRLVLLGSADLVLLCWPLLLVALHRPLPLEQRVLVEVEFVVVVVVLVVEVVIGNRTLRFCRFCNCHKLPDDIRDIVWLD